MLGPRIHAIYGRDSAPDDLDGDNVVYD